MEGVLVVEPELLQSTFRAQLSYPWARYPVMNSLIQEWTLPCPYVYPPREPNSDKVAKKMNEIENLSQPKMFKDLIHLCEWLRISWFAKNKPNIWFRPCWCEGVGQKSCSCKNDCASDCKNLPRNRQIPLWANELAVSLPLPLLCLPGPPALPPLKGLN